MFFVVVLFFFWEGGEGGQESGPPVSPLDLPLNFILGCESLFQSNSTPFFNLILHAFLLSADFFQT